MGAFDGIFNTVTTTGTEEEDTSLSALPPYLVAADNHDVMASGNNFSITDPASWAETAGNATKFLTAAVVSGAASFYNSGVAVGNFFGGDAEEVDVETVLADIDSDLGDYYQQNKFGADIVGFIAGSLVPGTLALKAIKAAKAGYIGENMAAATKLLVPETDLLIANAGKELAQSQALFSATNSSVLKAFGSSVGGAFVESVVAEAFIAATMFKSPILEDQDLGNLLANGLVGGALGGVIGGAIGSARVFSGIKKLVGGADKELMPVTARTAFAETAPASDKIAVAMFDQERVAAARITSDTLQPETVERTRAATLNTLDNDVRKQAQILTGGDSELGNILADNIKGMAAKDVQASLYGATNMARLSTRMKEETALAKVADEVNMSILDDVPKTPPYKIGYVKLHGEDAGKVFYDAPVIKRLADTVKNTDELLRRVKSYGFATGKVFNPALSKDNLEVQARYLWADRLEKIKEGTAIGQYDIPLLEKAVDLVSKGKAAPAFTVVSDTGEQVYKITTAEELLSYTKQAKTDLADTLAATKVRSKEKYSTEEIALITNTKRSFLEGQRGVDDSADYFARQAEKSAYTKKLREKGLWKDDKKDYPLDYLPSWGKIAYDTKKFDALDGNVLEGMAVYEQQYKLYSQGIDNAIANAVGDEQLYEQIVRIEDREVLDATRYGAQSGLLSFANSAYDSLGAKVQYLGSVTARLMDKFRNETLDALNPAGLALLSKPQAAIEFATINQKISSSAEKYILRDGQLIAKRYQQYLDDIAEGLEVVEPQFPEGTLLEIPIENSEVLDAVTAHIKVNGSRVGKEKVLRAAQGLENRVDEDVFYPIRKNYNDYSHFAFVVDEKIRGTGHVSMIHAATADALEQLMAKVPPEFKVITKNMSEDFHKAKGDYDYSRTLNENYINSALKRAGVDSDFFVQTDPQKIVDTWVSDQTRRDSVLARELVRAKNEKQFLELEKLGERYSGISASKYTSQLDRIEDVAKNPYYNYIKTALNISSMNEHPLLNNFNTVMDRAFSTAVRGVEGLIKPKMDEKDLEALNATLERYGAKSGYYDAATQLLANHSAPKGVLTDFIRKANTIVSTLALRLDPVNALNNAIGSNVLLGAETGFITRAIQSGNKEAVGRLTGLMSVKLPGTEQLIKSPKKLIANAVKKFFDADADDLKELYKANGWNATHLQQFRSMMDDLTLKGAENEVTMQTKMKAAIDKFSSLSQQGEKLTGNRLAEEYNRFVAASVMKQITDIAEEAGIFTRADSLATINSFVNKTQGNILASQRPLIFQGAIGSALGLFQTYQFNFMQQLFKYVGEGTAKDTAMLLGLQGSIYGMNGLPAFNFMNTHIVGTASGNQKHKDLFDATYGAAGKELGDWLMYGAASNLPKLAGLSGTNLYVRGDINPRHLSIVPINPVDFPAVNAIGKLYRNLTDLASKVTGDASVGESILQAIEHNGFSRPLAGLAQVAQAATGNNRVYATDTSGNLLGSNDLFSFSSLIRVSGAKPLDEAIVNDRFFTVKAYDAANRAKMDKLREEVKTSVIQGGVAEADQMAEFAKRYAEMGGKLKNFNKFVMNQYTNANTPASQRLAQELSNPLAQNMMEVMKGRLVNQ